MFHLLPVLVANLIIKKIIPDPVNNIKNSIVDNFIRGNVTPVRGSIVYCSLALGAAEHSGIFVGNRKIVHLDGSGNIELVSPRGFLSRLGGFNTAVSIYVSSAGSNSVGGKKIADRAMDMIGGSRKYNLIFDNCHQFSSGCVTGDFENSDNFLWMLKNTVEKNIDCDSWRVWDRSKK